MNRIVLILFLGLVSLIAKSQIHIEEPNYITWNKLAVKIDADTIKKSLVSDKNTNCFI